MPKIFGHICLVGIVVVAALDTNRTTAAQTGPIEAKTTIWVPDPAFGRSGYAGLPRPKAVSVQVSIFARKPQSDGKLVALAQYVQASYEASIKLVRIDTTGRIDTSFENTITLAGHNCGSDSGGSTLEVDSVDRIYVAVSGCNTTSLYRFTADGKEDSSFQPANPMQDSVQSMRLLANGAILLLGRSTQFHRPLIGRVLASGTADSTFGSAGNVALPDPHDHLETAREMSDGAIVFVSSDEIVDAGTLKTRFRVARLTAAGAFDGGNTTGTTLLEADRTDAGVWHFSIMADGQIGAVQSARAERRIFKANGSLDTTATRPPETQSDWGEIKDVVWMADNRSLLLIGNLCCSISPAVPPHRIVRLNPDWTLDKTFAVTPLADPKKWAFDFGFGNLLVTQHGVYISNRSVIARVNMTGELDAGYAEGGWAYLLRDVMATIDTVRIVVQADGATLVSANITNNARSPGQLDVDKSIVRLTQNGELDPGFGTFGVVTPALVYSEAIGIRYSPPITRQNNGFLLAGTSDSGYFLHAFTQSGQRDASFGVNSVVTVAVSGASSIPMTLSDVIHYADGGFALHGIYLTYTGGEGGGYIGISWISKHNPDGSLNTGFAQNGSWQRYGNLTAHAAQDGSQSIYLLDHAYPRMIRLSAAGVVDTAFGEAALPIPETITNNNGARYEFSKSRFLLPTPDGSVIAIVNAVAYTADPAIPQVLSIARITANGTLDKSFGDQGFVVINNARAASAHLEPDGGIELLQAAQTGFAFIRFTKSGARDTSFGINGYAQLPAYLNLSSAIMRSNTYLYSWNSSGPGVFGVWRSVLKEQSIRRVLLPVIGRA